MPQKTILALSLPFVGMCLFSSPCFSQTTGGSPKKQSVWVDAPAGSLLGRGFVDAGNREGQTRSVAVAGETPSLAQAIDRLNAEGNTVVGGWSLIGPAVALRSGVPLQTLNSQHSSTNLTYGELLAANSLAKATGKSFQTIVALKKKAGAWGPLAKQLGVNPESIVAQERAATDSIRYAEANKQKHRDQNLREVGLGAGQSRDRTMGGP